MINNTEKETPTKQVYSFSRQDIQQPDWKEFQISGKPYISWGNKNDLPNYLIELRDSSGMHNSILQKKSLYTYGKGPTQEIPQFKTGTEENLQAIIDDYLLYGMYAIQVIWSTDGSEIAYAEHVDLSKLRAGKKIGVGKIPFWYYSNDWNNTKKVENKIVEYPAYDPNTPEGSQIYVYKPYSSGLSYYSKPKYWSIQNYILLDWEISNFHINNVKNGFAPSMSIVMKDNPETQEERDDIYANLKAQYSGSQNAGEIFLIFADENGAEINPINANDSDQRYSQLMEIVKGQILSGHSITNPVLYGVETPGALGGRTELVEAYELTMNTEIKPTREKISKSLSEVLGIPPIEFEDASPVSFGFSETIMKDILTVDEMRDLIGYEPLPKVDNTISQEQPTNNTPTNG